MDKFKIFYISLIFYQILCVNKKWILKSYKHFKFSKILSSKIPHLRR